MRWTALTGGVRDRVPRGARPPRLEVTGDRLRHEFVERRLELTAPRRPAGLLVMPRRGDTRRLLDHDHVVVEVHDPDVVGPRGSRRRDVEDLHHVALLQAAGGIGAQVAVDEHVAPRTSFCTCDQLAGASRSRRNAAIVRPASAAVT